MTYQEALEIMKLAGYCLSTNNKGKEILSPPTKEYPIEVNQTAIRLWKKRGEGHE